MPAIPFIDPPSRSSSSAIEQTILSKEVIFFGEIKGSAELLIDGRIEGSINLPGNLVTVGRNGQVTANIDAHGIVIHGKVRGNVTASDNVEVRAEGALSGDIIAARINIEDGAYFMGAIDIHRSGHGPGSSIPVMFETPGTTTLQ